MTTKSKRTYSITALQRGLHILEMFSQSEGGMSASQVAKLSGFPVSTVHRFLVNLESAGYLNCSGTGIFPSSGLLASHWAKQREVNWIFAALVSHTFKS